MIVVGSLAELLLVSTSPPPETRAVLVTDAGALGATFTVIVIVELAPAASGSLRVQGILWPPSVHDQPVPPAAVATNPAGRLSVTVIPPVVGEAPVLLTVKV